MNSDIRISTSLISHVKTKKLIRKLGTEGFYSIISLWSYVGINRPDGNISDMDNIDLAIASNWDGDEDVFVDTLIDIGFLNRANGLFVHDWIKHNPYASGAEDRSDKSRFNKMKSHYPELYQELKEKGVHKVSSDEYQALVKQHLSTAQARESNAPSPVPVPVPVPVPTVKEEKQTIPFSEIVSFLNEKSGKNYKSTTKSTQRHISARWNEGFTIEDFKNVIAAKCGEWRNDSKMSKFLRPETLFGSKFEGYLNSSGSTGGLKMAPDCNKCAYNQSRPCKKITTPGFDVTTCQYFKDTDNG